MLLFETHHTSPLWLLKEPGCLTVSACLAHTVILSVERGTQEILCHEKEQWSEIKAIYPHFSMKTMCYTRACKKFCHTARNTAGLFFFFLVFFLINNTTISFQIFLDLRYELISNVFVPNHNNLHAFHYILLLKYPSVTALSSKKTPLFFRNSSSEKVIAFR